MPTNRSDLSIFQRPIGRYGNRNAWFPPLRIVAATNSISLEIPALDFSITGLTGQVAEIAFELPAFDFSASATVEIPVTANIALEIPALTLNVYGGAGIALSLPALTMQMEATTQSGSIAIEIPAFNLEAYSGARIALELPALTFSAAGTTQNVARLALEIPALSVELSGKTGEVAQIGIEIPAFDWAIRTGAVMAMELPTLSFTATGRVEQKAQIVLELPALSLSIAGTTPGSAQIALELPAFDFYAGTGNHITLELPAFDLAIAGTTIVAGDEVTYAINLTNGAVTTLGLGAFDKLVTAHGKLYGLRNGALKTLAGDLDNTTPIQTIVRFAQQSFNSIHAKRMSEVYLFAREDDGVVLEVVADETTLWRYYTTTDASPGLGTHKISVGKGMTFHTAGLTLRNKAGGRLDVGGIEVLVYESSRRPL
jgi:hypothetical protein